MPAKGKRVAVRQAQLNRRRRRQARSVAEDGEPSAVREGGSATASITASATAATATEVPSGDAGQGQPQPASVSVRSPVASSSQSRSAQPMAYTHLARELRRILILAGIVTVVLLGVSFAI